MKNLLLMLYQNKFFLVIELFILIGIPLVLIYLNPPTIDYRLKVMWGGIAYIWFVTNVLNISLGKLGLILHNFWDAAKDLIVPTFLTILTLLSLAYLYPVSIISQTEHIIVGSYSLIYVIGGYFLLSAPIQEFIFRSFLLSRLEFVSTNRRFLIFTSALIFGSIHLPLNNIGLTIGAYVLGMIWANNFLQHRNLFAVWLSHSLIGGVFLWIVHLSIT